MLCPNLFPHPVAHSPGESEPLTPCRSLSEGPAGTTAGRACQHFHYSSAIHLLRTVMFHGLCLARHFFSTAPYFKVIQEYLWGPHAAGVTSISFMPVEIRRDP